MAYCSKCGVELNENRNFCPGCGTKSDNKAGTYKTFDDMASTVSDTTDEFSKEDIEKNKMMAGFAYFLFFLPLIACPESKFARFHANQALVWLLAIIAANIAFGIINLATFFALSGIFWIIGKLFSLAMFIIWVFGLVNGFSGYAKELPVIGKMKLFS